MALTSLLPPTISAFIDELSAAGDDSSEGALAVVFIVFTAATLTSFVDITSAVVVRSPSQTCSSIDAVNVSAAAAVPSSASSHLSLHPLLSVQMSTTADTLSVQPE